MKNQKKQKNHDWDADDFPKKTSKKIAYEGNDAYGKKHTIKIKKKPKYKNNWLNLNDDEN